MSAEDIKSVIDDALEASEGGEKAAPLGIEADYGGAQDVLLMLGLAFERVAAKLNQGGATDTDGTKYLFMTGAQLKQFDTVRREVRGRWVRPGVGEWCPVRVGSPLLGTKTCAAHCFSYPLSLQSQDCENLVTDIEANFNEAMKPIDAKIDHWEKEFQVWETDVTKYTDMLGEIPEGLDTDSFLKAFPGYQEYQDTWQE